MLRNALQQFQAYLYIPIWFYSNNTTSADLMDAMIFTFQSGSIQINDIKTTFEDQYVFTFQSGSIQITPPPPPFIKIASLHSNLVLFKC